MAMSLARRQEIALKSLRLSLAEQGLLPLTMEAVEENAQELSDGIGIAIEEAKEFIEILVREIVDEAFPPRKSK